MDLGYVSCLISSKNGQILLSFLVSIQHVSGYDTSYLAVSAGLQNLLQIFVTNAANVFLLEVSPEYPILLEEQV